MHCPWKLVVFDWDGTLMPTTDLIVKSIQYTNARMGYRVPSVETIEMTIGMGRNDVMRIVKEEGPKILDQGYDQDCTMRLQIRKSVRCGRHIMPHSDRRRFFTIRKTKNIFPKLHRLSAMCFAKSLTDMNQRECPADG